MWLLQNCDRLSHSHGSNLLFEVQTETVGGEAAFINITLGQAQYSEEAMQHTKHQHHFLSTLWRSYPFTRLALRLLPLKALEQCDSKDTSNRMHHCLPKQTMDTSGVLRAAWTDLAGYIRRIQNQDSSSEPQKITNDNCMVFWQNPEQRLLPTIAPFPTDHSCINAIQPRNGLPDSFYNTDFFPDKSQKSSRPLNQKEPEILLHTEKMSFPGNLPLN